MAAALWLDEGTWRRWEGGKRQPVFKYIELTNSFLEMLASQPTHAFYENNITKSGREVVCLINTIEFSPSL
jgi:hypothetical protein